MPSSHEMKMTSPCGAGPDLSGKELPVVYRWAYAFGMPGAKQDFVPQNLPPDQVATHVGNQVPGLQGGGH